MARAARKKPDFESVRAMPVDRSFLSTACQAQLRRIASASQMQKQEVQSFVEDCSAIAAFVMETGPEQAVAQTRDQLLALAQEARRVQGALAKMRRDSVSAFNAHHAALAVLELEPLLKFPESARGREDARFLSIVWDYMTDLERAAEYAASQCRPSRSSKPEIARAKGLVYQVARSAFARTKQRPPHSKGSWFVRFMEELGLVVGVSCGQAVVESVLLADLNMALASRNPEGLRIIAPRSRTG